MLKALLFGLLIWFLYNLVFRFIIPVYKTTREVKRKFGEMHRKMQDQPQQRADFTNQPPAQKSTSQKKGGEYIDFEEIK